MGSRPLAAPTKFPLPGVFNIPPPLFSHVGRWDKVEAQRADPLGTGDAVGPGGGGISQSHQAGWVLFPMWVWFLIWGPFFGGGGGWFGAKGLVFRHGAGRGMSLGPCVWFAMMRPPKKPTCGGGGQGEIPFPRRVREGR